MITEIGAVKVRGGEVLGEFQTLVNPHAEIPPFIAVLTGITNSMVAGSPSIDSALPAFLEFAAGSVLVAHNAPFDVGFLQHFAKLQERPWPTVRGARHRQDRPAGGHPRRDPQLQAVQPRPALRLRPRRPTTALWPTPGRPSTCCTACSSGWAAWACTRWRSCRRSAPRSARPSAASDTWPSPCPTPPASTSSATTARRVLYIGTSRDLRTRVRTYFTASETRSRMGEMVALATSVDRHRVRHPAGGRGPRAPPDRRAQAPLQPAVPLPGEGALPQAHPSSPGRGSPWCARCSTTRPTTSDRSPPAGSPRSVLEALHDVFPVRQCSGRLPRRAVPLGLRARRDAALPGPVRRLRRLPHLRRPRRPAARAPGPDAGSRGHPDHRADGGAGRPTSGSRRPRPTGTGWPPSSAPPPAPSGSLP